MWLSVERTNNQITKQHSIVRKKRELILDLKCKKSTFIGTKTLWTAYNISISEHYSLCYNPPPPPTPPHPTPPLKFSRSVFIDCLPFYIPHENFSLVWRRHHCQWRAAKFWPMLNTGPLSREGSLVTPAVTWGIGFPVSSDGLRKWHMEMNDASLSNFIYTALYKCQIVQ
jgi:hypothetical protein